MRKLHEHEFMRKLRFVLPLDGETLEYGFESLPKLDSRSISIYLPTITYLASYISTSILLYIQYIFICIYTYTVNMNIYVYKHTTLPFKEITGVL